MMTPISVRRATALHSGNEHLLRNVECRVRLISFEVDGAKRAFALAGQAETFVSR
jgi:hypothetical protein